MPTIPICETFASIQGEGYFTGTMAYFVRVAGCNMACSFCDTDHSTTSHADLDELISEVVSSGLKHVVITGGEPTLYLDELCYIIRRLTPYVRIIQVETNGSLPLKDLCQIAWLTWSPKDPSHLKGQLFHEIKLLVDADGNTPVDIGHLAQYRCTHAFLQPVDPGTPGVPYLERIAPTIPHILKKMASHPYWRLSLQLHKLFDWR